MTDKREFFASVPTRQGLVLVIRPEWVGQTITVRASRKRTRNGRFVRGRMTYRAVVAPAPETIFPNLNKCSEH